MKEKNLKFRRKNQNNLQKKIKILKKNVIKFKGKKSKISEKEIENIKGKKSKILKKKNIKFEEKNLKLNIIFPPKCLFEKILVFKY